MYLHQHDLYQRVLSFATDLGRLSLWLVLLLIVFVPLERIFGHRPQKVFRQSFGADVFYYFVNGILPKLMMLIPLSLLAAGMHHLYPLALYSSVAAMPLWLRFAAALVVNEVGGYWGHRWSHEIPLLWRFHVIHHSAEEMDWLVTTRSHPVDMFFTHFCALFPLYVTGLAQPLASKADFAPMAVTAVTLYWAFFIHANVNWRFGFLEWLISTPHFHHWHHTNDSPQVLDKNYAATFPWMDKCFGTLHLPQEWPAKYGSDTTIAPDVTGQLLDPLTFSDLNLAEPPCVGMRTSLADSDTLGS